MIDMPNLPLLDGLRAIPYVGNPLADLVQPDLRYIVNLGYGNPAVGYSTGPADVSTPFGLFPHVAPNVLATDLVSGAQQGIGAAVGDFLAEGPPSFSSISGSLPTFSLPHPSLPAGLALPTSPASAISDFILDLAAANTSIGNTLATVVSTAYSTLQPTADIATALLVSLPTYDVSLFADGIVQALNGAPIQGLINAIGLPIAADVGLATPLLAFEAIINFQAIVSILTGAQFPHP